MKPYLAGPRHDTFDQFMSKIEQDTETGCWLWRGAQTVAGYGSVTLNLTRKVWPAHRVSYLLHVGDIPDGLQLDHLCRVRHCVNPDHLEPVSGAENLHRSALARTHCPHGHEYPPPVPGQRRRCPNCQRVQRRESMRRLAARRMPANPEAVKEEK